MPRLHALAFLVACLLSSATAFGVPGEITEDIHGLAGRAGISFSFQETDFPRQGFFAPVSSKNHALQKVVLQASALLENLQTPEQDTLTDKDASRKALDALKNNKRMAAIVNGRASYDIGATFLSGKGTKPEKNSWLFPAKAFLKKTPYDLAELRSVAEVDALPCPPPDRRSLPGKRPGDPRAGPGKLAGEKTAAVV